MCKPCSYEAFVMKQYVTVLPLLFLLGACGGGSTSNSTLPANSNTQSGNSTIPTGQTGATLTHLNAIRTQAGLPVYASNSQLQASATAHSNYLYTHNLMGHGEDPLLKSGFTGINASERAKAAGYKITSVSENISYNNDSGEALIDDLMTAVYHRMSLLDFDKNEIGIGLVQHTKTNTGALWSVLTTNSGLKEFNDLCVMGGEVIQSGTYYFCGDGFSKVSGARYDQIHASQRVQPPLNALSSSDVIVWPAANSIVPPAFYEESPDPLPECKVSGNPISVQVNPALNSQINLLPNTFTLKERSTQTPVALFRTLSNVTAQPDPAANSWQTNNVEWFAAFPTSRLKWGTTYEASISYNHGFATHTLNWKFTTQSLPAVSFTYDPVTPSISAVGQSQVVLYFPPGDCTAGASQVSTSATGASGTSPTVDLQYIDPHTVMLTTSGVTRVDVNFTQFTQLNTPKYTHNLTINY